MTPAQIQQIINAIENVGGAIGKTAAASVAALVKQAVISGITDFGWAVFFLLAAAVSARIGFIGYRHMNDTFPNKVGPFGTTHVGYWDSGYSVALVVGAGMAVVLVLASLLDVTAGVSDVFNPQGQVVQHFLCVANSSC